MLWCVLIVSTHAANRAKKETTETVEHQSGELSTTAYHFCRIERDVQLETVSGKCNQSVRHGFSGEKKDKRPTHRRNSRPVNSQLSRDETFSLPLYRCLKVVNRQIEMLSMKECEYLMAFIGSGRSSQIELILILYIIKHQPSPSYYQFISISIYHTHTHTHTHVYIYLHIWIYDIERR